jgi:hypothetical protein
MRAPVRTAVFAASFLALVPVGCDRSYTYQPLGPKASRPARWSESLEGVRFSVAPYRTNPESTSADMTLEITNESNKEVVVLGCQLIPGQDRMSAGGIDAKVIDSPEDRVARSVPAGTSKSVSLHFEFGGPVSKVLREDIMWDWQVRIGEKEHRVVVPMTRKTY